MAQLNWSIRIVDVSGGQSPFRPDLVPPVPAGTALEAQVADIVTWGNETKAVHQPWPVQADGAPVPAGPDGRPKTGFICDPIPPGGSSNRAYVVNGTVGTSILYCCWIHKNERGQIDIVADFI